jgi:hypothetical protein
MYPKVFTFKHIRNIIDNDEKMVEDNFEIFYFRHKIIIQTVIKNFLATKVAKI